MRIGKLLNELHKVANEHGDIEVLLHVTNHGNVTDSTKKLRADATLLED